MINFFKKYSIKFIFILAGMIIGFFLERITNICFEDKINPIALASLILTIIIALYLEFIVRPSLSNSRNEKDIIIGQLKDIRCACQQIQSVYNKIQQSSPIPTEEKGAMILHFRSLSNHIELLNDVIEYSQIKSINQNCHKLFSLYIKYKRSLTGYGFDKPDFIYDRINFSKHDLAFKTFDKAVMHLIFDVNKL